MGFGYRAAYIAKTAQYINQRHSSCYLHDLRRVPYEHARSELMKLHGVGAKVNILASVICVTLLGETDRRTHSMQYHSPADSTRMGN